MIFHKVTWNYIKLHEVKDEIEESLNKSEENLRKSEESLRKSRKVSYKSHRKKWTKHRLTFISTRSRFSCLISSITRQVHPLLNMLTEKLALVDIFAIFGLISSQEVCFKHGSSFSISCIVHVRMATSEQTVWWSCKWSLYVYCQPENEINNNCLKNYSKIDTTTGWPKSNFFISNSCNS